MKFREQRKLNNGFSLIEVLVAIVILAISTAPILTSLVLSSRADAQSEELLKNRLAVQSVCEQLLAEGFQGIEYEYTGPESTETIAKSINFPDASDVSVQNGRVSFSVSLNDATVEVTLKKATEPVLENDNGSETEEINYEVVDYLYDATVKCGSVTVNTKVSAMVTQIDLG